MKESPIQISFKISFFFFFLKPFCFSFCFFSHLPHLDKHTLTHLYRLEHFKHLQDFLVPISHWTVYYSTAGSMHLHSVSLLGATWISYNYSELSDCTFGSQDRSLQRGQRYSSKCQLDYTQITQLGFKRLRRKPFVRDKGPV